MQVFFFGQVDGRFFWILHFVNQVITQKTFRKNPVLLKAKRAVLNTGQRIF